MEYQELGPNSRAWIYQSSRELNEEEVIQIESAGKRFIEQWATHGKALSAALSIFHNRFIVLFADEAQVEASGCSIDASVHFIKQIEDAFKIDLFDRMQVAYEEDGKIKSMHLQEFREAIDNGVLPKDTQVFNNLIETKAEFEEKWKVPLEESWHSSLI